MIVYICKYFMFGYKPLTSEENLDQVYVKMENIKSEKLDLGIVGLYI